MTEAFEPGDVVVLVAGGVHMTVVEACGQKIGVLYADADGIIHETVLPAPTLWLVNKRHEATFRLAKELAENEIKADMSRLGRDCETSTMPPKVWEYPR